MPRFLHVGCGKKNKFQTTAGFASEEWQEIRFDIDKNVNPDIVGSIVDMAQVPNHSLDAVYSSHNIEHLYPHQVGIALKEFYRVLSEDGYLVITCPDLQEICKLVADDKLTDVAYNSPAGPIAPIDVIYGYRPAIKNGNEFMAHKCGFTRKALIGSLKGAGFQVIASIVREPPSFEIWAVASKKARTEFDIISLSEIHFPPQRPKINYREQN